MKPTSVIFFAVALALIASDTALAQQSREVTKTLPLKADGEVFIDTFKGSITIKAWDKPEVDVRARIESDDYTESEYASEKVQDTQIDIDATDHSVRIKTDYDHIRRHHGGFMSLFETDGSVPLVHYTISMPVGASLRIKDFKSETTISGLHSDIDVNTFKGQAEIREHAGSVRLNTYKGEARISFATMGGRSRIETYKGRLTVSVPKSLGFDLDANLGYRTDLRSDFDLENQNHARRHRDFEYGGSVNGGGPSLVLRSTRGQVDLRQR